MGVREQIIGVRAWNLSKWVFKLDYKGGHYVHADQTSIVFAHGLWADGSCFSKVIPTLQAEGHEVP